MGRVKKWGRDVNGVVLVDKPSGMSSNAVLQTVKRVFQANKAGHTGALDPLATGVLPICLGEATKFSQYLLDADKTYASTFALGASTSTADAEGEVVTMTSAASLTREQLAAAILPFTGLIEQVPPMYSALKKDGQPLYKLARKGIEVERKARQVQIKDFQLQSFKAGDLVLADVLVSCSKGTYIRSLAADLGESLGVGGHVQTLRRVESGPYLIEQCAGLSLLEQLAEESPSRLDERLLPVDSALYALPELTLHEVSVPYFLQGHTVMDAGVYRLGNEGDKVRVFRAPNQFLGLGEIVESGRVAPRRLMATSH